MKVILWYFVGDTRSWVQSFGWDWHNGYLESVNLEFSWLSKIGNVQCFVILSLHLTDKELLSAAYLFWCGWQIASLLKLVFKTNGHINDDPVSSLHWVCLSSDLLKRTCWSPLSYSLLCRDPSSYTHLLIFPLVYEFQLKLLCLFTSSQNLSSKLLHPYLETSLIHNLRASTHWGTWFHVFPASCSYALRSLAVMVESNHVVSVVYDQMPWHLISRMSHAICTGRM
jgi:hypothetical protein